MSRDRRSQGIGAAGIVVMTHTPMAGKVASSSGQLQLFPPLWFETYYLAVLKGGRFTSQGWYCLGIHKALETFGQRFWGMSKPQCFQFHISKHHPNCQCRARNLSLSFICSRFLFRSRQVSLRVLTAMESIAELLKPVYLFFSPMRGHQKQTIHYQFFLKQIC